MSRKSKKPQANQSLAKLYVFSVVDVNRQRVTVSAPVFYQLIRRGWASQSQIRNYPHKETRQPVEERVSLLVARLSFRSLKPTPEGNLSFASLLQTDGVSCGSWWQQVENAWIIEGFPRSRCPQTWEEKLALQQERQQLIEDECKTWGVPEPEPLQTGFYLTPEAAALAIAERQARL